MALALKFDGKDFAGFGLTWARQFVTSRTLLKPSIMRFYFIVGFLLSGLVASSAQTLQQALDATNLTWTTTGTGGAGGWFGQTNTSHDGVSAAKSAAQSSISSSQTSTFQTTVTGPGTLTFWWYGSEPDLDGSQLSCVVGTTTQATAVGGPNWTQQTVYVGAGSQTLKWVYSLPPFAPNFEPGYVDQVSWTPGSTAPVITNQPYAQSVVPGLNATFFAGAEGTPPLKYQWQLNGTNISTATNSSYTVTNAQAQHLGDYRAVISNSVGTNISSTASLEFGEVAVWGFDLLTDNRGIAPPGATNVLQISGGKHQSLLLRSNLTVVT